MPWRLPFKLSIEACSRRRPSSATPPRKGITASAKGLRPWNVAYMLASRHHRQRPRDVRGELALAPARKEGLASRDVSRPGQPKLEELRGLLLSGLLVVCVRVLRALVLHRGVTQDYFARRRRSRSSSISRSQRLCMSWSNFRTDAHVFMFHHPLSDRSEAEAFQGAIDLYIHGSSLTCN